MEKQMISLYVDKSDKDSALTKMSSKTGYRNMTYLIRALIEYYIGVNDKELDCFVRSIVTREVSLK